MPRVKLPLMVAAGLGIVLGSGFALGAAAPDPSPACWPLARIVGPEDFEVDLSTTPPRLLVSSQDRRHPERTGAVFAVDLDTGTRRRLPLRGRGRCSFHPHGVSLVPAAGGLPPRFYVINHHDRGDATAGCFPLEDGPLVDPVTSIEVFAVGEGELRFLQRLANPAVLTHANDLVALPSGDVYVTNPPGGTLSLLAELTGVTGLERSKVVGFRCVDRQATTGRCSGELSVTTPLGRYVNGIAYRKAGGGEPEKLFVAASGDAVVYVLAREDGGWKETETLPLEAGGDNLTWADLAKTRLLVAVHADFRRYVQHSRTPRAPAPSKVLEVTIAGGGPRAVFVDSGRLIRAASTAACARGTLILGQVFGDDLLRCWRPDVCPPEDGDAEKPAEDL